MLSVIPLTQLSLPDGEILRVRSQVLANKAVAVPLNGLDSTAVKMCAL